MRSARQASATTMANAIFAPVARPVRCRDPKALSTLSTIIEMLEFAPSLGKLLCSLEDETRSCCAIWIQDIMSMSESGMILVLWEMFQWLLMNFNLLFCNAFRSCFNIPWFCENINNKQWPFHKVCLGQVSIDKDNVYDADASTLIYDELLASLVVWSLLFLFLYVIPILYHFDFTNCLISTGYIVNKKHHTSYREYAADLVNVTMYLTTTEWVAPVSHICTHSLSSNDSQL